MRFKSHLLGLPLNERKLLAERAGTTLGTLGQVVYAGKHIELGLADCLVALCDGISLDDLPLTQRARRQHLVRSGLVPTALEQGT